LADDEGNWALRSGSFPGEVIDIDSDYVEFRGIHNDEGGAIDLS
jgi:hypothetical protein